MGYHLFIDGSGELIRGREIDRMGAHARGFNRAVGICIGGDNTTASQRWVWQQVDTLKRTLSVLNVLYPDATVLGHRDLPGTATLCPGIDVRNLLGLSPLATT
jgi:N-acetylmuramoyl-L-alanine amidase